MSRQLDISDPQPAQLLMPGWWAGGSAQLHSLLQPRGPQKPRRSRANLRPRSRHASVIDRLLKNQNPLENRNNLRSFSPHPGPGQTSGEPRRNFAVRNSSTREPWLFRSPVFSSGHATDPKYLAKRLGRPASDGCIRIPEAMNLFLDRHGVLDADYEQAAPHNPRFTALLLPDRTPTPLAGNALVIVDSSESAEPG